MDNQTEARLRKLLQDNQALRTDVQNLHSAVAELMKKPRTLTEEIDAIPGRRIVYTLSGDQSFTTSQDGQRANPISMLVSQDGPFIMTHYPVLGWYPNLPTNATNFNRWRPVSTYPLPQQQPAASAEAGGGILMDIVDVAYEIIDGGSQRNLQNLTVSPALISRFDEAPIPLPVPTLFSPNTTISIVVTYLNVAFASAGTATTSGNMHVDLPGYRIVNM